MGNSGRRTEPLLKYKKRLKKKEKKMIKEKINKTRALTSDNLKQVLWETIHGIRSESIDPSTANSIAAQSREIMRVVKTELYFGQLSGQKPVGKFLAQKSE